MSKDTRPRGATLASANQSLDALHNLNLYAVQQKTNAAKGGPEFWTVNPMTWPLLLGASFVAFTSSEEQAQILTELLNKDYEASQSEAPDKYVVAYEHVNVPRHDGPVKKYFVCQAPIVNGRPILPEDHAKATIVAVMEWGDDAKVAAEALNREYGLCEPAFRSKDGVRYPYMFIEHHIKHLAGRILTVLDASYVNDQQNKAVKRLVKDSIRDKLSEVWRECFTEDALRDSDSGEDAPDPLKD